MSRPETQLREYFDAGVERISVEDVVARAKVSEGGLQPLRVNRSLKPAWAAVGAFAATFVGLGGLVTILKLVPRITGDAGAGVAETIDAGGGTIGVWLVAALAAAVAAGLTVWLVHRSTKPKEHEEEIESEQGKVRVMETIETTDSDDRTTEKTEQQSRWPIVVIVVLAIALVGLIAWMTLAMRPNSPTAAPPEVQQLMEDYVAAFNAYDADALEELVTANYEFKPSFSGDWSNDMEKMRSDFLPMLESWDWHNHYDGPFYAVGSGSSLLVSSEGVRMTATSSEFYPDGYQDGVTVFRVVKVGDEWKVAEHSGGTQS